MSNRGRRLVFWTLGILALATVVHYATIVAYPRIVMSSFYRALAQLAGTNTFLHLDRPTAKNRMVRIPSPDLVYSAAAFDLSEGPLRVTVPVSEFYTSISLYAANTDNFFIVNDRQVKNGKFDLVLVAPGAADPGIEGAEVVRAPSTTGVMILRYLLGNGADLKTVDSSRRQAKCVVVE